MEALEARVRELELELVERSERTNSALAHAQDRVYWLDRLGLDLNALMARPMAARMAGLLPILGRARYLVRRLIASLRHSRI